MPYSALYHITPLYVPWYSSIIDLIIRVIGAAAGCETLLRPGSYVGQDLLRPGSYVGQDLDGAYMPYKLYHTLPQHTMIGEARLRHTG